MGPERAERKEFQWARVGGERRNRRNRWKAAEGAFERNLPH